ncbi:MAG: PQQ-dependent dehydrogenase, methanol/ethanol family [Acidobacteria bacterium]|nr:PQQ-dependent dehydrogenase, methanol/ethanol family [Acidobacteriota bacterium]
MRFLTLFLFCASVFAQHPDVASGRKLFRSACSACHGDNAKGGRGPDLTTGEWKHGGSDEDLIRNITKGIPGTQMPAIPLPEADTRRIIAFMRSLLAQAEPIPGNPEAGRAVFTAQCSKCHMFSANGGRFAPDLTRVRNRHKASELRKTIAEPVAIYEVRSANVTTIGARKQEDTFTLLLMDQSEKIYSFNKRTVNITKKNQPHPTLNPTDTDNVVAFLMKYDASSIPAPAWSPAADFNVTYDRLRNAAKEPWNWLTYWGDFAGRHASALKQITPQNVTRLRNDWSYQFGGNTVETMPIVVEGLMFVTGPLNNAAALDARTGRTIWKYTRQLPSNVASHCTVMTNRGFAVLGDRLFLATLDMHLVSLDAKTGNVIYDIEVDDYKKGFSITHAPLAIDGKIIVGVTSGECALYGWVDAYDAATGKRLWRTHSVAQPGDPNRKSWNPEPSAQFGGSPTWTTGTYDPETETIFWPTGNPGPDYDGSVRQGDNLYSCSVLALDAKTGRMKWYFQFTPHDVHDWDGNQTPVLIDGVIRGQKRKLLVTAQRNAFYYVLDRNTGEFLAGRAFAKQTWAKGLDDKGRPIVLPNTTPTPQGNYVCPDAAGAANWGAPSIDPITGFFLVSVREACATYFSATKPPVPGEGYTGGGQEIDRKIGTPGSVRALDPLTGEKKWDFPLEIGSSATGVLATAGGVVFASSNDGNLIALESKTGKYLWHYYTGANIISSPITYSVDGKQYVAIASQSALYVFSVNQ